MSPTEPLTDVAARSVLPLWTSSRFDLRDASGWQVATPAHWALNPRTLEHWWHGSDAASGGFKLQVTSVAAQGSAPWHTVEIVAGMPVWAVIDPAAQTVQLFSQQARQELFWKDCLQTLGAWDTETELAQYLQALDRFKAPATQANDSLAAPAPSVWQQVSARYAMPALDNGPDIAPWVNALQPKLLAYRPSMLERIMNWSLDQMTQYDALRGPLLRFVALLPSLDYDKGGEVLKANALEVLYTLQALAKQSPQAVPSWLAGWLNTAAPLAHAMPSGLMGQWVRSRVRWSARRFIVGETLEEALPAIAKLAASNRQVTLDPLGEVVLCDQEAQAYERRVLALIEQLGQQFNGPNQSEQPLTVARNKAGLPLAHLSLKVSALGANLRSEAYSAAQAQVVPRLRRVLMAAQQAGVFITVDAEHYKLRDLIFTLWKDTLLSTPELANWADTGMVVQAYLQDAWPHLQAVIALAKQRQQRICVRLVKGAYWDMETLEAQAQGHPAPQWMNKEETDLQFRQLIHGILAQGEWLQLAVGSHNLADHCYAEALRQEQFTSAPAIEHQCLHQTFEALSLAMAQSGWVVRDYVPVGNLLVGMAYLVRRILENASQVGVLAASRKSLSALTVDPLHVHQQKQAAGTLHDDPINGLADGSFANVPPVRLEHVEERSVLEGALSAFQPVGLFDQFPALSGEMHTSFNPSYPDQTVGQIRFATEQDTMLAVDILHRTFVMDGWDQWPVAHRAMVLSRAADLLLAQRPAMAVLIVKEAGKTLPEALADVDESIDFLNFYAREAVALQHQYPQVLARGVAAVIAPWNFPMALACGMVAGALATGNPVALKSSQQTVLVADAFVRLLHSAGVPESALIHVPGAGSVVGNTLVAHPQVATVLFTGSREVGVQILQTAGARVYQHPKTGLHLPVQVVAELGGKNTIVVTADADLDEAVAGIVASACSHAGQKCSAASRVLVDERIAKPLAKRLTLALAQWQTGPADDWNTQINPVISAREQQRLRKAAQAATAEAHEFGGRVWLDRTAEEGAGHVVGPLLVELPPRRALFHDSMAQQELFGPLLHLIPFDTLEQALQLANSGPYGLTAGVYSQSPTTVQYLLDHLEVGNVYANRSITGARVSIEPFGGLKHSGTGPKAGCADYLKVLVTVPGVEYPFQVQTAQPVTLRQQGLDSLITHRQTPLTLAPKVPRLTTLSALDHVINLSEDTNPVAGKLARLHHWLETEGERWLTKGRENRRIPGQSSVNRYARPVGPVLVVAEQPHVSPWLMPPVWMALWLGCPVTVVTVTEEAHANWHSWQQTVEALEPQLIKHQWQLTSVPLAQVKDLVAQGGWPVVLVDGGPDTVTRCVQWVAAGQGNHPQFAKVLSATSHGVSGDWAGLFHRLTQPISWAINQVRHGAVLSE